MRKIRIREKDGIAGSWTEIDWGESGTVTKKDLLDLFILALQHTPTGMPSTEVREVFEVALNKRRREK